MTNEGKHDSRASKSKDFICEYVVKYDILKSNWLQLYSFKRFLSFRGDPLLQNVKNCSLNSRFYSRCVKFVFEYLNINDQRNLNFKRKNKLDGTRREYFPQFIKQVCGLYFQRKITIMFYKTLEVVFPQIYVHFWAHVLDFDNGGIKKNELVPCSSMRQHFEPFLIFLWRMFLPSSLFALELGLIHFIFQDRKLLSFNFAWSVMKFLHDLLLFWHSLPIALICFDLKENSAEAVEKNKDFFVTRNGDLRSRKKMAVLKNVLVAGFRES